MKLPNRKPPASVALVVVLFGIAFGQIACGQPSSQSAAQFQEYVRGVESRIDRQHRSATGFLAAMPAGSVLDHDNIVLEQLTPDGGLDLPGALLHHWRGTAFVPGATAVQFEELLRNFPAYPHVFSPQVEVARLLPNGEIEMRVLQKHVITVVLDSTYKVQFGQLDGKHRYSSSRSTQITEIENAGTSRERALPDAQAHGFLWRLNTYWSCEERDGGLYIQIETLSLTRGIPAGLGWAVRPFIESVPRESLAFTLNAVRIALERKSRRTQ